MLTREPVEVVVKALRLRRVPRFAAREAFFAGPADEEVEVHDLVEIVEMKIEIAPGLREHGTFPSRIVFLPHVVLMWTPAHVVGVARKQIEHPKLRAEALGFFHVVFVV